MGNSISSAVGLDSALRLQLASGPGGHGSAADGDCFEAAVVQALLDGEGGRWHRHSSLNESKATRCATRHAPGMVAACHPPARALYLQRRQVTLLRTSNRHLALLMQRGAVTAGRPIIVLLLPALRLPERLQL